MNWYSLRFLISAMALSLVVSTLAIDTAEAGRFSGKIITSHKRIPTSAKSKRAYYAKLRKQSRDKFWENKKKKQWKIYYAAFFKRPLNDLEVTVKLYDVTEGRRLVSAYEQWLQTRGQKEIISFIKLDREKFGVNRRILMTVENRGRVLASGKFKILGEAEKYSGKVEFTAEEANSSAP